MGDGSVSFDSIDPGEGPLGTDPGLPNVALALPGGRYSSAASPFNPIGNSDGSGNSATKYGVAAAGFALLGGLLKGMSAIQSAGYNADTARGNATLADQAAGDAILRGHIAATAQLLKGTALASKQKSAYAGAGVSVNSGSAVQVEQSTQTMSGLDAMIAENSAAKEAWGYRTKADQFRQQAAIDEAEGRNQLGESILGGVLGAASYGTKTMLSIS